MCSRAVKKQSKNSWARAWRRFSIFTLKSESEILNLGSGFKKVPSNEERSTNNMQWSYPELRRRMIAAELWPEGRVARLACYLGAMAVGLFALKKLLGLFAAPWGDHLGGWITFLTCIAVVLFSILAFRWLKRRILWRVRNRLIVTYVFIGVIPAVLLLSMAGITLYGLAGQFAVFVVTSEIQSQLRSLESANAAVSNELAARLGMVRGQAIAIVQRVERRGPHRSKFRKGPFSRHCPR